MDHADLWKDFERTGAEEFESLAQWVGAVKPAAILGAGRMRLWEGYIGRWADQTFATFKALRARGIGSYIYRDLTMPTAAKVSDVFEACRFVLTPGGGLYRDQSERLVAERCGGPGFRYLSGVSRGRTFAPYRSNVGAERYTRGDGIRGTRGGQGSAAPYVKPVAAVLDAWRERMGDPDGTVQNDRGFSGPFPTYDFALTGFEAVEREDGILIIAGSGSGIFKQWVALLDKGETVRSMLPPADLALIEAEEAADLAAWGETR